MANDKQYDLDELNQKLEKMNDLLKSGEKRFEELLKIVNNLQKAGGKGGMYGSDATTEIFKRAEKKTTEFNKQMDKMHQVRQLLIDAEYDRVGDLEKERQERTKQFILMRRETHAMVESQKTKRKEMSLQAKRLDLIGRMAGGAGGGLAGFIGMGVGTAIGGFQQGTEGAGKKAGGLQQRMLNYQKQMEQSKYSSTNQFIGTEKSQKAFISRMEKISPKLTDLTFGKKGDDGDRKGGALGKGAGAMGKMGGALGLAGGLGGGLLGGAIMKGLEASPMFQAISKIMSQAFNLILRPIGDFFSAVFKPISITLMKWGALNLRKWAEAYGKGINEAMNTADLIGKSVVAFFSDPLKFLQVTSTFIVNSITQGIYGVLYDFFAAPIKGFLTSPLIGMKEEDVKKIIGDPVYTAYDEFVKEINGMYTTTNEYIEKELGTIGGQIAAGAGVASDIQTKSEQAQKTLDKIAENTGSKTTPFGGYGSAEEQQSELDRLIKESQEAFPKAWEKAMSGKQTNVNDTGSAQVGFNYDKAVELSGMTAEQWANMSEESREVYQKFIDYKNGVYDMQKANEEVLTAYREHAEWNSNAEATLASVQAQNILLQRVASRQMNVDMKGSKGDMSAIKGTTKLMVDDIFDAYKHAHDKLEEMKNYGKKSSGGQGGSASSGAAMAAFRASRGLAGGGLINERIFGIGERTGSSYLFGESGNEYVVPGSKSTGLGGVTINVNVAKMSSDVDLQKLKPIIERAILEVHSRRGII